MCKTCEKRKVCKEICPKVEALLPKKTTGRHKKELLFGGYVLELLATERAFFLKFGKSFRQNQAQNEENKAI